jgi:hypothetical protein
MLFGSIFFIFSEIYTLVLNKEYNIILEEKKSLFGKRKFKFFNLNLITKVKIIKRGHIKRDTNTTYFIIAFEFKDGSVFETFYDRKISDIKKKFTDILIFLNMGEGYDFKNIPI